MGRAPCCDKANVKKGPWSPDEDLILKQFIEKQGTGGNWISLPHRAGLKRCGKSCRLRWLNYLRPNIKHGEFSDDEDRIICTLYSSIGSRWSIIAAQLPGRTDNDIKNYWNTKLKKKILISSSTNNSGTSATMLVPSIFSDQHHHTSINLIHHHQSPYQVSLPSSTYYDQKPILMNSSSNLLNNNTTTYSPPNLMSLLSDNQSQHSCSSSDNGSTSNQVSYGTSTTTTPTFIGSTHEQNMANYHEGFYNFNISGVEDHDGVHKSSSIPTPSGGVSSLSYDQWDERQNGLWSDHQNHQQQQYTLEDIKELVSSNPNHNSGCNNFFMADAQEKFMMYY
ncbi:hypothetical protein MKX01_003597 [Papaver californicum]|nr:hypothetical protein MKX01_003597 [Papaver californicum]